MKNNGGVSTAVALCALILTGCNASEAPDTIGGPGTGTGTGSGTGTGMTDKSPGGGLPILEAAGESRMADCTLVYSAEYRDPGAPLEDPPFERQEYYTASFDVADLTPGDPRPAIATVCGIVRPGQSPITCPGHYTSCVGTPPDDPVCRQAPVDFVNGKMVVDCGTIRWENGGSRDHHFTYATLRY